MIWIIGLTKHFLSLTLIIPNFLPVLKLLTFFLVIFLFIPLTSIVQTILISYSRQLNNLAIVSFEDLSYTLVVTNASIKNNVATSITHIHICNRPIIKTVHYVVNVTSTEAELFTIRCGINQATNIHGILKIVVITNLIHSAQKFFDASHHPFQIHVVFILKKLRKFFVQNHNNSIEFWKCPSQCNWSLHKVVNKETKLFKPIPRYSCKLSWNFSKKSECDKILSSWKMTFQASDLKKCQFLDLYDEDNNPLELSYAKRGTWLKYFGHSNSLCTRVTRAITNHAPIGEYRLIFFLWEDFRCLCSNYLIETRQHILYECRRYNEYWNLRRDTINHFILFLEFNHRVFTFESAIT